MSIYTYEAKDGTKITLPRMGELPAGVLRKHRKLEPIDMMFSIVEASCDEATLEAMDNLPVTELNEMFELWEKDSGTSMGEPSRSSS